MTLTDWLAGGVSDYRQSNTVACIECETSEGAEFTTGERLILLAAKLALNSPVFSIAGDRYEVDNFIRAREI
jgi:hypothetical protein